MKNYMNGKKHKERAPSFSTLDFHFQKSGDPVPTATPKGTSRTLDTMLIDSSVLQAEVRLALKVVMSRYSKSSCNNITELFKIMFLDSDIVKSFTCAKTKCRYMIVYGLAPYFQSCLLDDLEDNAMLFLMMSVSTVHCILDRQILLFDFGTVQKSYLKIAI